MKSKYIYLYIIATLCIAFAGFFLPGFLLQKKNTAGTGSVQPVPETYYSASSSAIARSASAKLSSYERTLLVSGIWESEITEAAATEIDQSEYAAVLLAQESIESLYQNGVYPVSLISVSGDWYSWESTLYKATETTFHTYTAYFWKIILTRYEGSETHTILMLEDGTILSANALCTTNNAAFKNIRDMKPYLTLQFTKGNIKPSFIDNEGHTLFPTYDVSPGVFLNNMHSYYMVAGNDSVTDYETFQNLYKNNNQRQNEYYYVSQKSKGNEYLYCIIPYDGK